MSQRMVNATNVGPEIDNPEVELDKEQVEFDGQTYQFGMNPKDRRVLPDGASVQDNVKLDDSRSGITHPYDEEAKSG